MTYLYWRGNILWCRFPKQHPTGIRRFGTTKAENDRCLLAGAAYLKKLQSLNLEGDRFERVRKIGAAVLNSLQDHEIQSLLFDKPKEVQRTYNPRLWRIIGRYWKNALRFKKSGKNERYHLLASLRRLGKRYAKEITRDDIVLWMNEQKLQGVAVNTINNRFGYFKAAYRHSCNEQDVRYNLGYDPVSGMQKLSGGNVRKFLLTPEKFERNYAHLKKTSPRFALYYLALWELGRRPEEVSFYEWDMVNERVVNGQTVQCFEVPGAITKTGDDDRAYFTPRLWGEMKNLGYRHGIVFRNALGKRWSNWEHHTLKLRKAFGKDAGVVRDTRRGFVTRKYDNGFSQFSIMKQTGHKTTATFQRYLVVDDSNQISVVLGIPHTTGVQSHEMGS